MTYSDPRQHAYAVEQHPTAGQYTVDHQHRTMPDPGWRPMPPRPVEPAQDAITASPEFTQGYAHYVAQGAPLDYAHREAYQWAAQQLASRVHQSQQHGQPSVVINNNVNANAQAGVGYMPRKIGLTSGMHTLHLVATLLTCGLWAPVWIIHAAAAGRTVR